MFLSSFEEENAPLRRHRMYFNFVFISTFLQDMLDTDVPDKFSVITYVSQFYHLLKDEDNSRSPSLKLKGIKESSLNSSADTSSDSSCANSPSTPTSVPR